MGYKFLHSSTEEDGKRMKKEEYASVLCERDSNSEESKKKIILQGSALIKLTLVFQLYLFTLFW
jgi:hypothetical protein